MASTAQLDALRRAADVEVDDTTYRESLLDSLIDALGVNGAALTIWREKMAAYAKLVSISEAGSSRQMSDLYNHAKEMVEMYRKLVDAEATPGTSDLDGMTYVVGIERR